jgi:serine protease DegQ
LIKQGKVVRGYFGIEPEDISQEIADVYKLPTATGVHVRGVVPQGPAARGGIEPGDIIVSINDLRVDNTAALLNQIAKLTPASAGRVVVLRNAKEMGLTVTVGERPIAERR